MPEPILKTCTKTKTVDLDVTGLGYRIETGDGPTWDPETLAVSGLSITYKRVEEKRGAVTEIVDITYQVSGDPHCDSASVHPDSLDKPQAWPGWVRDLVAHYRPGP